MVFRHPSRFILKGKTVEPLSLPAKKDQLVSIHDPFCTCPEFLPFPNPAR